MSIFAMALMVMVGLAGALVIDDESSADSASSASVELSDNIVATEKTLTATLKFSADSGFTTGSYTAKLVNSSGTTQSGALSSTSGTIGSVPYSKDITVTAPKTAGKYTLEVEFTATISGEKSVQNVSKTIEVREPITLSVEISNNGSLAVSNAPVYFYVDGVKVVESEQKLTVAPGDKTTVSYKYFNKDLSAGHHTFKLVSSDASYNITGLEKSYDFYYEQGNNDLMTWIMVIVFIVVLIAAIFVFRKPVKNYGKPKARR
ncbi:MAG: hypothetical protein MJZ38_02370 [archaeon]|nr:hypothetical protein [archaeon]